MSDFPENAEERARLYSEWHGCPIIDRLGAGIDGTVFATEYQTAIKAYDRQRTYRMERDVYLRLQDRGATTIRGHHVPQLVDFDDYLWVIEISVVKRPYILDFAKATIDVAPDFPPEVMREWLHRKSQDFGPHWPAVVAIMDELVHQYGVHLTDLNQGNIAFEKRHD